MKVRFTFDGVRSLRYIRGDLLLVLDNGRELFFSDTDKVSCEVSDGEKTFDAFEDDVAGNRADGDGRFGGES